MKKALILTDGKAGHENQSRVFARSLGLEFDLLPVQFKSKAVKAWSYLLDRIGIRTLSLFKPLSVPAGNYAVVVGTGSGVFYAVKALARKLGAANAVILYPRGYDIKSFDCILAPEFDDPPQSANTLTIPVNLTAADEDFYASGVKEFLVRYTPKKSAEAVAVIVGGPNKCSSMTADWMRKKLENIFAENPDSEKWITTSRRTPPEVEAVIDSFPFDYKLIYSRDRFNPIPAFVSLATKLYVTAESTGMLSEACTHGKSEVHVLDNLNPGPHKFRKFAEFCAKLGSAKVDLSGKFADARRLLRLD